MTGYKNSNPHIVGFTGSFGSGCTYVADNILSPEYKKTSLSGILRELYKTTKGSDPTCRSDLQEFGDLVREKEGADALANRAIAYIDDSGESKCAVDSIRNPAEVQALRNYSNNFYLMGVYADKEARWRRVKGVYGEDRTSFDRDDMKDRGKDSPAYGQHVSDCFYEADIVLRNEEHFQVVGNADFRGFAERVRQLVALIQQPLTNRQVMRNDEAMMAMAYAVSQRSSCLQRKVGAVVTDAGGNIISSGFNEVPPGEKPCADEHTRCYRAVQREGFFDCLQEIIPDFKEKYESEVDEKFRERFRVLDLCRALHAEENAILNLARHGRSAAAEECTLYTTTYPCRMCANRIAQLGIRRVVYLEPYPDDEAKAILGDNQVITQFFEGIAFRAYFRVYGEKR